MRIANNDLPDEKIVMDDLDQISVPDVLPVLAIHRMVAFPYVTMRLVLPAKHRQIINDAMQANQLIGIFTQQEARGASPEKSLPEFGAVARVLSVNPLPDGTSFITVQAFKRIRNLEILTKMPYLTARIETAPEITGDDIDVEALRRKVESLVLQVIEMNPQLPDNLAEWVHQIKTPLQLCYLVAGNVKMEPVQRQAILDHDRIEAKMQDLIGALSRELEVLKVSNDIESQVKTGMDKKQREMYLRQRLEAIQKELGEGHEPQGDANKYRERIEASALSEEARKEAERELGRLASMSPHAPDYSMTKNYLDWLLDLPWGESSEDHIEIDQARAILNRDHHGIETVKERVIEYLMVHQMLRQRQPEGDAAKTTTTGANRVILCLSGPPGTGKTSLGKSIAEALGRKYTRMSLGGIHDEAEIRGHRRTYIGSMPGRIIQAIKRAGTRNPVFVLDEIDKIGHDWRGDPSSALLEVLDPEQNANFRDHYLDVDFDLSDVMFIATANQLETIPPPLLDRMDIIRLEGYTDQEKFEIARKHLIPRQLEAHGLEAAEVVLDDAAVHKLIGDYTREAGVRSLERLIGAVCRKSIVTLKEEKQDRLTVGEETVKQMLKKERFEHEPTEHISIPGIATGLAVTPTGGEILYVEASRVPGKGRLELTGQLGKVMQESARIAYSYVRSRAKDLGIAPEAFRTSDIHLHVPAGALPKDGPSAGVAMVMAIAGIYTGRVAPADTGFTGEITLRGRVLPVGGIKSKVLAAHRAGLKRVILPGRNRRDEDDLPEDVRKDITLEWAETIDDALCLWGLDRIPLAHGQ